MNVKQQNLLTIFQTEVGKKLTSVFLTESSKSFFRLYLKIFTKSITDGTHRLSKLITEDELLFSFSGVRKEYSNSNFNFLVACEVAGELPMLFEAFESLNDSNDPLKRGHFAEYLISKSGLSKEQLLTVLTGTDSKYIFWLHEILLEKSCSFDNKEILDNIFKNLLSLTTECDLIKKRLVEYTGLYQTVANCDIESLSVRFRLAVNLFQEFDGLENELKNFVSFEELKKVSEPWFSKTLISLITKEKVWTDVLLDELCETMIVKKSSSNG